MPVAVGGPPMAASTSKLDNKAQPEDAPPHDASPLKKSRKRTRKDAKVAVPAAGTSNSLEDEPWSWQSLTDSSASRVAPVFTKDGNYFFSVADSSVKIYSVATGKLVSTLNATVPDSAASSDPLNSSDTITSAIVNPHNPFQLITGSLGGYIRVWDFLDATLLQTISIPQPIYNLAAHVKFQDFVVVAAGRPSKKGPVDDNINVLRISLTPKETTAGSSTQTSSEVFLVGKTRATTGLAFSPSGEWLVATGGHKAYVCATSNFKSGFTKFVSPEQLTCLAFHPSEEYFATGDVTGCIRLWYCLNASGAAFKAKGVEKTAQTTTLHWHAHAVSSIAFTENGAYLLSGGEEAVLVIWQLHTGKKEYVPRVGAPIAHVSVVRQAEGEEYLLALADASFVFISSTTLKISRSIARVKLDPSVSYGRSSTPLSAPLAVHSVSSTLILPASHPSSLQTFSPSTSKLISELEVSPSNRVSRRDEKALEPSRVDRAVISDSGEWMVTIDTREPDEYFHGEVYMKIWWWDSKAGYWILNTRVDNPHGMHKITEASFRPGTKSQDNLLLVTTGEDGNIKTWRVRSVIMKSGETDTHWTTLSTFRFRSEIPTHASWSSDGSLLAVSLGTHVVIYDPISTTVSQVLTWPECKSVRAAHFIGRNSRYLAVHGARDVVVWDLVMQCSRWHYRTSSVIDRIIPHPFEEIFAVFERPAVNDAASPVTRVLTFRPSSAMPSASRTLPFRFLNVIPQRLPNASLDDLNSFSFIGITASWSVVVFGDIVRLPEEEGATARGLANNVVPARRTLLQDIFGKSAFVDLAADSTASAVTTAEPLSGKGTEVSRIFDTPAHLLPPISTLFDDIMGGFLTARPANQLQDEPDAQEDARDDDVDMDAEAGNDPVVLGPRPVRIVDQVEMDAFTELFRAHGIKTSPSSQPPIPPHRQSNGIQKQNVNGTHARMNGTHSPAPSTPKDVSSAAHVPITPDHSSNAASEVVTTGKKRKKSLG